MNIESQTSIHLTVYCCCNKPIVKPDMKNLYIS